MVCVTCEVITRHYSIRLVPSARSVTHVTHISDLQALLACGYFKRERSSIFRAEYVVLRIASDRLTEVGQRNPRHRFALKRYYYVLFLECTRETHTNIKVVCYGE